MTLVAYFCCLLPLLFPSLGEPSSRPALKSRTTLPSCEQDHGTPQERLLAELLARLPEEERAGMIARALVAARESHSLSAAGQASPPCSDRVLIDLQQGQSELATALSRLQLETERLRHKVDQWHELSSGEEALGNHSPERQLAEGTFVLPTYRRPGVPAMPGPTVNQPSGPELVWQPLLDSPAATGRELLQLQQALRALDQRLRQLQGGLLPKPQSGEATVHEPGGSGQAARPLPLLPR